MIKEDVENLISYLLTMYAYENGVEIQTVKIKEEREDSQFANYGTKTFLCEINLK